MAVTTMTVETTTRIGAFSATGSGAMAEILAAVSPHRLDAVFLNITGAAAAEDFVISLYDVDDNLINIYRIVPMAGVTNWSLMPERALPVGAGWYVTFAWTNTGATDWRLTAVLVDY